MRYLPWSGRSAVLLVLGYLLLGAALPAGAIVPQEQKRELYRQAIGHLHAGRAPAFRQARTALDDYPLAPYLDYYEVESRLGRISDADMLAFQSRHADLPVTPLLHRRWLKMMGARNDWARLLAHYQETADPELRCYRLRALQATGDRAAAMEAVPELWTVGRSQPKACDPLFESWIRGGHLTETMAWERMQLALRADQRQLARYLLRFFDGPLKPWARALYDVHVDPQSVSRRGIWSRDESAARVVIAHGIRRLAAQNAAAASAAWQRYQDSHAVSDEAAREVSEAVVLAMARAGDFPSRAPALVSAGFAEGMADAALAVENWKAVAEWIERMPQDRRNDLRWQYWLGRALQQSQLQSERATQTWKAIADERHYYGFLAASRLGQPTRLNAAAERNDPTIRARLETLPPVQRALELYAVGDLVNARREWFALVPRLTTDERFYAARLANEIGWVNQGIAIANQGELRDDVALRFPVAYTDAFLRTSQITSVPKPFLMAVARQESAFDPKARSHANAHGLMQLLTPTASHVARRAGLAEPTAFQLYDPATNVELGGRHLARLLERYENRRPVAAAAYNAGEGRVDRWLRNGAGRPMDVWIETIPFRETRDYVKNVLAGTQVYGHLLQSPQPVLGPHETQIN
ncbi:MAG: transglycosylase SLT domain-containing protein [Pseudomonadales bacterium]